MVITSRLFAVALVTLAAPSCRDRPLAETGRDGVATDGPMDAIGGEPVDAAADGSIDAIDAIDAIDGDVGACPPCAATELCRWREVLRDYACVPNPCVGQPLTCDCAQSACRLDWGPGMPPTCTATMKDGVDIVCTGGGMCASPDTPIATPAGPRAIATLAAGDLVWSVNHDALVAVPLVRVQRTPAPNHHVVRLELDDATVLEISARHPLADGRSFGSLGVGERLDGRVIVSRAFIPYRPLHTYDILPASETGAYFAGGVLLGSTLE